MGIPLGILSEFFSEHWKGHFMSGLVMDKGIYLESNFNAQWKTSPWKSLAWVLIQALQENIASGKMDPG